MIHIPFIAKLYRLWPLGRTQTVLLASVLFFAVGGILGHWGRMRANEERMAARLEQRLMEESRRLQSLMQDSVFIQKITSEDGFNDEECQKWRSEVFGFFLYKYDDLIENQPDAQLIRWTNNHSDPSGKLDFYKDTMLVLSYEKDIKLNDTNALDKLFLEVQCKLPVETIKKLNKDDKKKLLGEIVKALPIDTLRQLPGEIIRELPVEIIKKWPKDTILYDKTEDQHYLYFSRFFLSKDNKKYLLVGSLPVLIKYFVENQYLQESFPLSPSLNGNVSWKALMDNVGTIVHGPGTNTPKEPIFKIHAYEIPLKNRYLTINRVFLILGTLGFLVGASRFSRWTTARRGPMVGLAFFSVQLVLLRVIVPILTIETGNASESISGFQWVCRGPADMLFNAVLLFWLAIYVFQHVRFSKQAAWAWRFGLLRSETVFQMMAALLVFGLSWLYGYIFTLDSAPRLQYVFVTDLGGVYAVLALVLSHFSVFLLVYKLCRAGMAQHPSGSFPSTSSWWAAMAAGLLALLTQDLFSALLLSTFVVGLLWGMHRFVRKKQFSAIWTVAWLLYFSAFSAAQLYVQENRAELRFQKSFAEQLATEQDQAFESRFAEVGKELLQDPVVKARFSPSVNKAFMKTGDNNFLQRYLKLKYLDKNFFSDYEYSFFGYQKDTLAKCLFRQIDPVENPVEYCQLDTIFDRWTKANVVTDNLILGFSSNTDSSYSYMARLLYQKSKDTIIGVVFLRFTPKPLLQTNVYEKLLSNKNPSKQKHLSDLEFAVYKENINRREEGGRFPKKPDPGWTISDSTVKDSFFSEKNKNYLVFKGAKNIVAVVRAETPPPTRAFSLFSFLFCFHLGVLSLLLLTNRWMNYLPDLFVLPMGKNLSLRGRIQIAVVAVILLAFAAIAAATLLYNRQQLAKNHESQNKRYVATIISPLEKWQRATQCSPFKPDDFLQEVKSIDNTGRLVVNLYDLDGKLLGASVKENKQRKIVADPMDPIAYSMLTKRRENLYVQTEQIGTYSLRAAYAPLKDQDGQDIAYVQVPYDPDGDRSVWHENVELLGTLINVYVLLLLIAGAVALTVANYITRPLAVVADKLQHVQLGRRSEPLEWKTDDEIGTLIRRYNEMIQQLEESSAELARTQKETAWREMAKQVAHEIKNPLTPMKIHLQLLERAFRDDPERGLEMYRRVSASLIEQIDNLARIASEFSDFAKMPQAQNERLLLNALVGSVCELFRDMPEADLTVEMPEAPLFVWADRNQLMRVLNNLLKNAEQAIPKERRGQIQVRLEEKDGHAHISVRDNGTGIPEEMIEKVFLPNFTTKSSGMGLGLAMSKNIVETANGRIRFDTAANEGTVFLIELPLMSENPD